MSLTDNLRALVLGFSAVEPLMNMLLSRHAETHVISQDARDESASLSDIRVSRLNTRCRYRGTNETLGFHRQCKANE